jgi:hypothetical protein
MLATCGMNRSGDVVSRVAQIDEGNCAGHANSLRAARDVQPIRRPTAA